MKIRLSLLAIAVSFSTHAWAQQAQDPMQQMMDAMQSPQAQQMMQQMMQNQEIDLSNQPGLNNHNCDEGKLRRCSSGYTCEGKDGKGGGSMATIHGRTGDRCHVTMKNADGSTGECRYSDASIEDILRIERTKKVKIQEAIAMGQRMMAECSFKDAKGNPVQFDQMRPVGRN